MLAGHSEMPAGHSEMPAGHSEMPAGHSEMLAGHSEMLAGHSEMLAGHSEMLAGHSEMLAGHSEMFAGHSEMLAGHSEMLAGHSEMLAGHSEIVRDLTKVDGLHPDLVYDYFREVGGEVREVVDEVREVACEVNSVPLRVSSSTEAQRTTEMKLFIALVLAALSLRADTTVTLLHFSDYHSHALPFYTDEGERGGIARAIGYLRAQKQAGALVFSGGDTINKGAPAWSDKYQCADWPWWNGILDAMAFGNHDADYGRDAFDKCRAAVRYPILSANTNGFRGTAVFNVRGARIGVFALAGDDFPKLVKVPGFTFTDPIAAAKEAVRVLRNEQHADAVVMIGHQEEEADSAMARAVPGIDVIFGSHSHLKRDLVHIPGTNTVYISPSQYLTYISRLEVTIADHRVKTVRGGLIPVDDSLPADARIARRVANMQRDLERDPQYRELFAVIGRLDAPLSTEALARRTVETMRDVAKADIALSTKSTFRQPLPAGPLTMETLLAAMPYENEIVVCTMSAAQLQRFLDAAGPDSFVTAFNPAPTYRVATTDFVATVARKDVFDCDGTRTGLRVREEMRKRLAGT
jgi:5'-nucleotidase / UDP-sugar diphosphatase